MKIGEGMVSSVYLQNGIVSKQYITPFHKYAVRNIKEHWKAELKALEKLKGKKHFPQLVSVDHANHIIYMSYCGESLTKENLPRDWEKQCAAIDSTLNRCSIYPFDFIGQQANPTPPYNKNILVKDGIIHLIDFGIWSNKLSKELQSPTGVITQVSKS